MSTIIITEKTSQKRDVQAAVGSNFGRIYPAEGHLLSLVEPQKVQSSWGKWSFDLLKPDDFYPTCPSPDASPSAKGKLQAIADALKTAKRVILATDCDREGQLIGEEILRHYQFNGIVERAMFTAQDEKTLRQAFDNLEPNEKYFNLGQAAVVRQQADQVYNLSLTRAATVALKQPGQYGAIGIGRVKTPTMAIVCMRELEILDFTPQDYYHLIATATIDAPGNIPSGPENSADKLQLDLRHAPKDKILDLDKAEQIRTAVEGFTGPIKAEKKIKKTKPPRLLDLPELQKICARRWGWSADKTLNIAQELYDGEGKKIQTYPRAESRYLAENQIDDIGEIIQGLSKLTQYQSPELARDLAKPEVRKGKTGHFSDAGLKGVSHHAIVPNKNTMDKIEVIYPRLTPDEKRMFDLVASSYLAILMPDYVYESTNISMAVPVTLPEEKPRVLDFKITGNIPKEQGWKAVYTDDMEKKDDHVGELPPVQDGDLATLMPVVTDTKKTKAPPRYNEGTLIDAMQNSWRFVDDKDLKERLKEAKGIGTPATRAAVITGLKLQNFLTQSGKHIVPTDAGLTLYKTLKAAAPELVDPGVTAMWEMHLDDVLQGKQSARQVWDNIGNDTARLISILRTNGPTAPKINTGVAMPKSAGKGKPTDKMKDAAKSIAASKGLKLPKGYTSDFNACREFLDEHLGGKGPSPERVLANLEKQLSGGLINGLGAKAAKQLAEAYGPETLNIIQHTPEKLDTLEGLPKAKLKLLQEWSIERKATREIGTFLHTNGVDPCRAFRLYQAYGEATIAKLKEDPYCIVRDVRGLPFDIPDTLAHRLDFPAESISRACAAIFHALSLTADYKNKDTLLSMLNKRLSLPLDLLETALETEIEGKHLHKLKRKDVEGQTQEYLIVRTLWQAESKIVKRLKSMIDVTPAWGGIEADKAILWITGREGISLSPAQQHAVKHLLSSHLSVLTGSPYTGKQQTVRAFLRILDAKGIKLALACPAAGDVKRFAKNTDLEATSLSKLLEYNTKTDSYKRTARKTLDCQLLVINQAQLLDRPQLLAALDALPENAGLLLIDDFRRMALPGTGRTLKETINTVGLTPLTLTELSPEETNNRLAHNCLRIAQSQALDLSTTPANTNPEEKNNFYFVEAKDPEDSQRKLIEIAKNRLPKSFKLDAIRDIQIISLAGGDLSSQRLAPHLQQLINPVKDGLFVDRFNSRFRINDKIILGETDLARDLIAGEIGCIKDINRDDLPSGSDTLINIDSGQVTIDFSSKSHDFSFDELDRLSLAFALPATRCKTRQMKAVVVLLPQDTQSITNLNNIAFYEAITSAQELAVVIGPKITPEL
ncbi:DNA topoisomerase [Kiloniella antarctica]|uniref:DNA topoisomerase n=1 Tax=Kiloniella antarctica TaxID=1550907 RepID=A0ABW5BJE4_9PROT